MTLQFSDIPTLFQKISDEMGKVIIGQKDVIEQVTLSLLCKGHVLLIGAPGLAKTTLVQSFANALDLNFNRIQFTPDLMPSDIIGTEILQENQSTGEKELRFTHGPIFTNMLLADEINRTPPKTQAALLQAMQEKKVTVFGNTQSLSEPFMVLATQNPIEQEGTYPLPEAQLDRFLFAVHLDYPTYEQELEVAKRTTLGQTVPVKPVLSLNDITAMQQMVNQAKVAEHIYQFAVKAVRATRPGNPQAPKIVKDYVRWGAGPRAVQFLIVSAKAKALIAGRPSPSETDLTDLLYATLNHRLLLNFNAEADGIQIQDILKEIVKLL